VQQDQKKGSKWKHLSTAYAIVKTIGANWTWSELTFGLEYYARHQGQQPRNFADFIDQTIAIDTQLRLRWRRFAQLTYQVFREPIDHSLSICALRPDSVLLFDKTPKEMRPGYFVCIDHLTESILLIFRGTKSLADVITDLHASSVPFRNGFVHKGIYESAQWFQNNKILKDLVKKMLLEYPKFKLRLLGHSLGAGTASLLAILWKQDFPELECIAFASPPVLSHQLSKECSSYVTTFVNGDDFVPRLSTRSIEDLRQEIQKYNWKEEVKKELSNTAIAKLAKGTKDVLSNVATGVSHLFIMIDSHV
jgi:hypothetical protein